MTIGFLGRLTVNVRRFQRGLPEGEAKLGTPARLLFGGYLISAVGTGMVYPFMAIYVQEVRGLGGRAAAVALAIIALGTIGGSLAAGPSVDRMGPRLVGSVALVLQAAGYGLVGVSSALTDILVACILIGAGTGIFYSALTPAINLTCSPSQRRRAFATRYMINNLGVGAGILISLAALSTYDTSRFAILYEVDAASYIVFLVLYCAALSGRTAHVHDSEVAETAQGPFRWRSLLSNRPFIRLLIVETLLVAGGFSQIQSVIPLLLRVRLGTPTSLIALLISLNCFGIVLIQPLVVRLSSRVPEGRLLVSMGAAWAGAFAVAAGASAGGSIGISALVLFGIIYTLGECFYGPSFHPLVVKVAPKDQVGRYSSIVWSLWGAVSFIAPPLGVLLVNSKSPYLLWLVCGLFSGCASLCSLGLRPAKLGCHTAAVIARRVPGEPSTAPSSPASSAISSVPSQTSSKALTVCWTGECARS
jgi:Na+/melibiose symporter-like transporter